MDWKIDDQWTLFLDRDGTINTLLPGDYVKTWDEFKFIDGVLDAIPIFNKLFGLTLIATNQQGIGKKIMTEKSLRSIHVKMLTAITESGGYIDEVYYCPALASEQAECRKPDIGMAIQAVRDFPNIDLKKSIMIGDTLTDMQFGKNAGMKTILLTSDKTLSSKFVPFVNYCVSDLATLADLFIDQYNLAF